MDDKQLRQDVLDVLEWEPSINAAYIGVTVESGVVTLSGHVGTYTEKIAAERVTERMAGVRGIAQEIEVRDGRMRGNSDDEVANRALAAIDWDAWLPKDAIQVSVENGCVTLNGSVEWEYQRTAAEEDVRRLKGIRSLTNLISIKAHLQMDDLPKRIEEAMKGNIRAGIQININSSNHSRSRADV